MVAEVVLQALHQGLMLAVEEGVAVVELVRMALLSHHFLLQILA
jgi:hypothetical protein